MKLVLFALIGATFATSATDIFVRQNREIRAIVDWCYPDPDVPQRTYIAAKWRALKIELVKLAAATPSRILWRLGRYKEICSYMRDQCRWIKGHLHEDSAADNEYVLADEVLADNKVSEATKFIDAFLVWFRRFMATHDASTWTTRQFRQLLFEGVPAAELAVGLNADQTFVAKDNTIRQGLDRQYAESRERHREGMGRIVNELKIGLVRARLTTPEAVRWALTRTNELVSDLRHVVRDPIPTREGLAYVHSADELFVRQDHHIRDQVDRTFGERRAQTTGISLYCLELGIGIIRAMHTVGPAIEWSKGKSIEVWNSLCQRPEGDVLDEPPMQEHLVDGLVEERPVNIELGEDEPANLQQIPVRPRIHTEAIALRSQDGRVPQRVHTEAIGEAFRSRGRAEQVHTETEGLRSQDHHQGFFESSPRRREMPPRELLMGAPRIGPNGRKQVPLDRLLQNIPPSEDSDDDIPDEAFFDALEE